MITVETLVVGDRMRISVELIRQIAEYPNFASFVVYLKEIRVEDDGTKTLVLERVSPAGE
jgi:hypothetical protein